MTTLTQGLGIAERILLFLRRNRLTDEERARVREGEAYRKRKRARKQRRKGNEERAAILEEEANAALAEALRLRSLR